MGYLKHSRNLCMAACFAAFVMLPACDEGATRFVVSLLVSSGLGVTLFDWEYRRGSRGE